MAANKYCENRKSADIEIKFLDQPLIRVSIDKCPTEITTEPAPLPEGFFCDARFTFGGRDRVQGNDYYYDGRVIFQPQESAGYLYYIKSIAINNANELWLSRQGSPAIELIAEVPAQSGIFIAKTLPAPLRINFGDLVFVDRRINNGVRDLPAIFGCNYCRVPINRWRVNILDKLGRLLFFDGVGMPDIKVSCRGCGDNQIDCGGCCVDCGELSNKMRAINERL